MALGPQFPHERHFTIPTVKEERMSSDPAPEATTRPVPANAPTIPVVAEAPRMATATTISPKAILAAVVPALGGLIAVAIEYAVTGDLDRLELTTALTAFGSALVAGLGAYVGAPGKVAVPAKIVP